MDNHMDNHMDNDTPNVASMPQDYWAYTGEAELKPLGVCEDFDAAAAREPPNTIWLFSRTALLELQAQIAQELG